MMENRSRAVNEPPRRSILEEVGNAVTHGVGALFAIAGLVLLLLRSSSPLKLLCTIVYGFCLIMMFLMSCLYHSFRWGSRVKRLWRRFDYISIYLLIGGTFTPLWLLFWQGRLGAILCCAQWAVIIAGITFVAVFGPLFITTLTGGIIYTIGIIPFALKRKGAHFLWHFFVFFGAVVHWLGIYLFLY